MISGSTWDQDIYIPNYIPNYRHVGITGEKRVFKINIGELKTEDVEEYMKKIKEKLKLN